MTETNNFAEAISLLEEWRLRPESLMKKKINRRIIWKQIEFHLTHEIHAVVEKFNSWKEDEFLPKDECNEMIEKAYQSKGTFPPMDKIHEWMNSGEISKIEDAYKLLSSIQHKETKTTFALRFAKSAILNGDIDKIYVAASMLPLLIKEENPDAVYEFVKKIINSEYIKTDKGYSLKYKLISSLVEICVSNFFSFDEVKSFIEKLFLHHNIKFIKDFSLKLSSKVKYIGEGGESGTRERVTAENQRDEIIEKINKIIYYFDEKNLELMDRNSRLKYQENLHSFRYGLLRMIPVDILSNFITEKVSDENDENYREYKSAVFYGAGLIIKKKRIILHDFVDYYLSQRESV